MNSRSNGHLPYSSQCISRNIPTRKAQLERCHQIDVSLNNHNVAAEHKALREAVLEGKPLLMTGREGAKTVAVCRAVVEAANTGKAVQVDYNF